ncbi:MAG: molybdopterin molybdotransferase MoeA [Burkholderiales bacterium]
MTASSSPAFLAPRPTLLPLDDALAQLLSFATPEIGVAAAYELVDTFEADGRVLAQDLHSPLHIPPQDNSSMDGYAVRCSDVQNPAAQLSVSQRIAAGSEGSPLQPGTVARIFTGAPIPAGADAVVMQEDCELLAELPAQSVDSALPRIRIAQTPQPGQWIRRAGEDVSRGAVVLRRGARLSPASLGLAAGIGQAQLPLVRRPRVAIFSTGDELVMPGSVAPAQMKPGTIYNSNRFFLRALLKRLGCAVTDRGIVPDQREATIDALREASAAHDVILTSGGVSVGEEDHIKPAVQALGSLHVWQLAMKPGKPFAYGKIGAAHFLGLPGNPVSSLVTFVLLVRPFLLALQGASQVHEPSVLLPAHFSWPRADKRREFLRVRRNAAGGLDLFPNQSSGVLTSTVWGDGLVDNPAGQTIGHGDAVRFISFAQLFN